MKTEITFSPNMLPDTHMLYTALDFFAGSGLVTEGLSPFFETIWANDICAKKMAVYTANFGRDHFLLKSIRDVSGEELPKADLAWASFPCQDLSLAGKMQGLEQGSRSALFWEWLRVLDEMPYDSRPSVLCVENVVGFLVADSSRQFHLAYSALRNRGYKAGAFVIDARHFTPQSRPRSFIIAVKEAVSVHGLTCWGPLTKYHPQSVVRAFKAVRDPEWIWWFLPPLPSHGESFTDICESDAPINPSEKTNALLNMLSETNLKKLNAAKERGVFIAGTGYKRIRKDSDGQKKQRFEIRFDGLSGCLRTPRGGSSRQIVVMIDGGEVKTRLLTIKETSRLMGVRDSYQIPGTYNEAYMAMGDAVAVPVTNFLSRHLLAPLCQRGKNESISRNAEMMNVIG